MTKGGHMSKLVIGLAAFVLLAAGGALAGGALSGSSPDDAVTTATTPDETSTTRNGTATAPRPARTFGARTTEAEHVGDPRCAAGAVVRRDDDDRADETDD